MRIKYDGARDKVFIPEMKNLEVRKGEEFDCPEAGLAGRLLFGEGMSEVFPAKAVEKKEDLEAKPKKAKAKKVEGEE